MDNKGRNDRLTLVNVARCKLNKSTQLDKQVLNNIKLKLGCKLRFGAVARRERQKQKIKKILQNFSQRKKIRKILNNISTNCKKVPIACSDVSQKKQELHNPVDKEECFVRALYTEEELIHIQKRLRGVEEGRVSTPPLPVLVAESPVLSPCLAEPEIEFAESVPEITREQCIESESQVISSRDSSPVSETDFVLFLDEIECATDSSPLLHPRPFEIKAESEPVEVDRQCTVLEQEPRLGCSFCPDLPPATQPVDESVTEVELVQPVEPEAELETESRSVFHSVLQTESSETLESRPVVEQEPRPGCSFWAVRPPATSVSEPHVPNGSNGSGGANRAGGAGKLGTVRRKRRKSKLTVRTRHAPRSSLVPEEPTRLNLKEPMYVNPHENEKVVDLVPFWYEPTNPPSPTPSDDEDRPITLEDIKNVQDLCNYVGTGSDFVAFLNKENVVVDRMRVYTYVTWIYGLLRDVRNFKVSSKIKSKSFKDREEKITLCFREIEKLVNYLALDDIKLKFKN